MILMVHNSYRGGGGEDVSASLEAEMLRDAGLLSHFEVVDNRLIDGMNPLQKAAAAWRSHYDLDGARQRLQALVNGPARSAKIMHVQNFFPLLTPAVHEAGHEAGLLNVQHVRNFRMSCVNAKFFREGGVCEDCLSGNPWQGVRHGCHHRGRLAGAMVARMITTARDKETWERHVDAFITMSAIGTDKLSAEGADLDRIYSKPNFAPPAPELGPPSESRDFLFVGRLDEAKGVETLVEAWLQSMAEGPSRLLVVGDGPARASLERLLQDRPGGKPNVSLLGRLPHSEVLDLMGRCRCVVQPARWYETFGRTVVEAFSRGRPVLASEIGALVDLVDEGTGARAKPGDVSSWADALTRMEGAGGAVDEKGATALKRYRAFFTPEKNVVALSRIYRAILDRAGAPVPEELRGVAPAPHGSHYSEWL